MIRVFMVITGCLLVWIALVELILIPKEVPNYQLTDWDRFVGFGSILASGILLGTKWFYRGSESDHIERGESLRHWAKAIVISTEIVAGLVIVLWAAVNDPNMLRDMLSGF